VTRIRDDKTAQHATTLPELQVMYPFGKTLAVTFKLTNGTLHECSFIASFLVVEIRGVLEICAKCTVMSISDEPVMSQTKSSDFFCKLMCVGSSA